MQLQHKAETNAVYDEAAFLRDRNRALNQKLYRVDMPDIQVDLVATAGSLEGTSYANPLLRNNSGDRYAKSGHRTNQLDTAPTISITHCTDPLSPEQESCHESPTGIDQSNPHETMDPDQWVETAVSAMQMSIQPIFEDQEDEEWSPGAISPPSERRRVQFGRGIAQPDTAPHGVSDERELRRNAPDEDDVNRSSVTRVEEYVDIGHVSNQRQARKKKGKLSRAASNNPNMRDVKGERTDTKQEHARDGERYPRQPDTQHDTSVVETVDNPLGQRTLA